MKPITSILIENSSAVVATATSGVAVFLVVYAIADAGGVSSAVAICEAIFVTPFIVILAIAVILIYKMEASAIKDMLDFFDGAAEKGAAKTPLQEDNEKILEEIFGTTDLASIKSAVASMYSELEELRTAKDVAVTDDIVSRKEVGLDDFLARITRGNSKFPPPTLGHIRTVIAREGLAIYQKEVAADDGQ